MKDLDRSATRMLSLVIAAVVLALAGAGASVPAGRSRSMSEPVQIAFLARIHEPAWAWGSEASLCIDGKRLYIPLGYPGLAIYDIGRPSSPVRLGGIHSLALGGQAGAVAAAGSRVFVALPDKNLIVELDATDPSRLKIAFRVKAAPDIQQLQIRGDYLYAFCGSRMGQKGGIVVYNTSDAKPRAAGRYLKDLIDPGFFITKEGTAFFARTPATGVDSAKIESVDMSRPSAPVFLSRWGSSTPGNITDMDLKRGRLYCSAYWGGLWILDASDAAALKLVASFDWNEPRFYAKSVKAYPPYIFVAQGGPDLSDQKFAFLKETGTSVRLWRQIAASTYTHSVALAGNLLFLVEQESAWASSNPQKIVRVYRIKQPSSSASGIRSAREGPR